jgi:oxygen-independent coproporphyrinogen III oxidase
MAGIYIHIPFCKQKCIYCNFFSLASSRFTDDFFLSLLKEIRLQKNYIGFEKINTIYFGGGTPSLVKVDNIKKVLDEIQKFYLVDDNPEITLEANPDDISNSFLKGLRSTSVNRLSIGVQSFFDEDLKYLNRIHQSKQAEEAIMRSQDNGFENLSIDLIYGIPTLTSENWEHNIDKTVQIGIPHISAYSLTLEPNTILDHHIKKGKREIIDENKSIAQYEYLIKRMKQENFLHYEISNFCKEGFISKHNSAYWKEEKYLGLGPSAHSFNQESRQWNVSNITEYVEKIGKSEIPFEIEFLSEEQKYNEYVLTSLRTIWGCDLNYIKENFGQLYYDHCIKQAATFLQSEKMLKENNILFLTDQGKFFADGIASVLFF